MPLIANADLAAHHIPSDDAPMSDLNAFALTFNGYARWGNAACARIANERVHHSLDHLRTCLFFEARRLHFAVHLVPVGETQGQARQRQRDMLAEDAEALRYWRELVRKIREHVARGSG